MSLPSSDTVDSLTRCVRLPGFFPGSYLDQFIRKISFEEIDGYGRQVEINTASSLGGVASYAPGDTLLTTPGAVDVPTTFTFKRLGGAVEVDSADIDASGTENDQIEIQTEMKRINLVRSLGAQVVMGDGSGNTIRGIRQYALDYPTQVIDLFGTAATLDDLHWLVTRVRPSDGLVGAGPDALVVNSSGWRAILGLLDASSGCGPCFQFDQDLGVPVLRFDGLPVYVTDVIPVLNPSGDPPMGTSEMLAVKLTGPTGVRVLHVGGSSDDFGVIVEENEPQIDIAKRGRTVRGYYAVLVPEYASVAMLDGVLVPA